MPQFQIFVKLMCSDERDSEDKIHIINLHKINYIAKTRGHILSEYKKKTMIDLKDFLFFSSEPIEKVYKRLSEPVNFEDENIVKQTKRLKRKIDR